jgi:hypothetical protein
LEKEWDFKILDLIWFLVGVIFGIRWSCKLGWIDISIDSTIRYRFCSDIAYSSRACDSLLDAANIMRGYLDLHGLFLTWLEIVFEGFYEEVRHSDIFKILKALHEKDAAFLIINYDDLLEKIYDLFRIDRLNRKKILKFKYENLDGVFYIENWYIHHPFG